MGMVSKKLDENDVRVMFNHFGTIEECTVLRDNHGISKGKRKTRPDKKICTMSVTLRAHLDLTYVTQPSDIGHTTI